MGRGKNYTNEYKEMISDLYSSGMSLAEISGVCQESCRINIYIHNFFGFIS